MAELEAQIARLPHHTYRTLGTRTLYLTYQERISRRQLTQLISQERTRRHRARRAQWQRLTWHGPNLVWALDGAEYEPDAQGQKLRLAILQDLVSSCQLEPLVAFELLGSRIAEHLQGLFEKHGAPLFLKRDNGANLNEPQIQAVLAQYGVIPLNSPRACPRYKRPAGVRRRLPPPAREVACALFPYRFTYFKSLTTVGDTNLQALFTILNARTYGGVTNQAIINLLNASGAIKHTSPVVYYLIRNGSLSGNPNFQSLASNSCSLYDTAATTVTYSTGDQLLATFQLGETGSFDHHFGNGNYNAEEITLQPGEWITIAARAVTGTPSYVTGSINTREDQ